jgi:hypothetical protein
MDRGAKDKLKGHLERMEEDRMPKISSPKNWKGRNVEENPGNDGKRT